MQKYLLDRVPLFYVFVSGIGFSLQTLVIKLLAKEGFHGTFECILFRGIMQLLLASIYMYYDEDRLAGKGPSLFGDSLRIKFMLLMRSLAGFASISFAFLAVELISIGDTTVLTKISPMLTAMLSFCILGEPWRVPEFCATILCLCGAVLVAKPPFIFGGNEVKAEIFYTGVGYALISSVCAAFAFLFVRILGTTAKMPWANVCFSQALGQIVLSIPCSYLFGQTLRFDIPAYQVGMLVLGGFIGAVSQILMTMGMQREKSAAATAMRMSDVAFGFLWQALFTPDKVHLLSLCGAILVTLSAFLIVVTKEAQVPVAGPSPTAVAQNEVEMRWLRDHDNSELPERYQCDLDLESRKSFGASSAEETGSETMALLRTTSSAAKAKR